MARSASPIPGGEARNRRGRKPHVIGRMRSERGEPPPGLGDDILDQQTDQPAHEFVHQAGGIERRISRADIGDDLSGQPQGGDLVEPEQIGAQAIVDIVGVVGDIVGDGGDLRLRAGEAPQLKVLQLRILPRIVAGTP